MNAQKIKNILIAYLRTPCRRFAGTIREVLSTRPPQRSTACFPPARGCSSSFGICQMGLNLCKNHCPRQSKEMLTFPKTKIFCTALCQYAPYYN